MARILFFDPTEEFGGVAERIRNRFKSGLILLANLNEANKAIRSAEVRVVISSYSASNSQPIELFSTYETLTEGDATFLMIDRASLLPKFFREKMIVLNDDSADGLISELEFIGIE